MYWVFFLNISGANPCEHGGRCLNTKGSFQCKCLQGYEGPRCEMDVNECMSNPCHNDATCLDQIGGFHCICMPGRVIETVTLHIIDNWWKINSPGLTSLKLAGYEGVFCHINTDECASQPCLNNGKCVDKINSFHCECPKGENIICDEEKAHEKKQVIRIHLSLLGKTMSSGKNLWKSGSLKQLSLSRVCLVLRLVTDLPHPMMSNIFFLLRILTRVSSYWNIWRYEDLCLHLGPKL